MSKMEIRSFTREEKKMLLIVGLVLLVFAFLNFRISLRKARDVQRKADVNSMVGALEKYHEDFGFYPPSSEDGRIVLCEKEGGREILEDTSSTLPLKERMLLAFYPCDWSVDSFRDIYDDSYSPYLDILPHDPRSGEGGSYLYVSDTRFFQLYGSLEGKKEPEFDKAIQDLNLNCGAGICNFGKTLNNVPLDESLEEYENELLEDVKE